GILVDSFQWLVCPTFYPILIANKPKLNITSQVNYAFRIENRGCLDTMQCIYYSTNTTSVGDDPEVKLQVYPNPVSEELHIYGNFQEKGTVHIYTMQGQEVYHDLIQPEKILNINVRDFVPGSYIIRIATSGKWLTHKVIVN